MDDIKEAEILQFKLKHIEVEGFPVAVVGVRDGLIELKVEDGLKLTTTGALHLCMALVSAVKTIEDANKGKE